MDSEDLERCWTKSSNFFEFEESLSKCRYRPELDQAAWRDAAAFLYSKAVTTDAVRRNSEVSTSRYEPFPYPDDFFLDSPVVRPKFTRGTVEGDMIHAISPGSTPNRTASVLSPLNISTATTPPTGQRSNERRPLAPVVPVMLQSDNKRTSGIACKASHEAGCSELDRVPSPPSFTSESSDQPESRQLRAEAFPTRQFLNNSTSSSDLTICKENLTMEGLSILSPSGSISVQSPTHLIQEGCNSDGATAYMRRSSSKGRLHLQTTYGVTSQSALSAAHDERKVGYFPQRVSTASSTVPSPKGSSTIHMPVRQGTGSTPAPPTRRATRASTSPRQSKSPPPLMKMSRASQPPPQAHAVKLVALGGAATMPNVSGAVRNATLTPTSSGSLRPSPSPTFGGAQCGGSFGAALGGNAGTGQYQCTTSAPMLFRMETKVVSPRF